MATTTTVVTVQKPPYDKTTALFASIGCAWLLGVHGVHRCYVGDTGLGILQCLTCGGCCIWSIIDWINIENIVDDANRRAGWSGAQTVTTTTAAVQQPGMVVYQQPPPGAVVYQQAPPGAVVYQQPPPGAIVYQQPPPGTVVYTQ